MSIAQPKIAILLAAYNGMAWIEEQIDSIQAQVDVGVTVYISIDPSEDGTEAWCASYAKAHSNTVILPPAGRFGGAARNFFRLLRDVDFSTYDYVAFSDQDDIWNHDKLSRAVDVLASGVYDGYSSNVTAFWPDGRRMLINKAQPQVKWDHLYESAGPGCTYVMTLDLSLEFKRSLLLHWDQAQNVTLHDWYCYAFARSRGYRWMIDFVPGMAYRQHLENQVGANTNIKSYVTRFGKIIDGWWGAQVELIALLVGETDNYSNLSLSRRLRFLGLVFSAMHCRRRCRDKVVFVVACLICAIHT